MTSGVLSTKAHLAQESSPPNLRRSDPPMYVSHASCLDFCSS